MENLLFLATLVGGLLPKANGFDYLADSDVAGLLPEADLLDEALYNEIAGSAVGRASFAGLQPDILGERFVLDRVSADGIAGLNARRLLLAAWSFQPSHLFRGMRAMALVELAEVSRRMGDHVRADGFLSKAVGDPDARKETLIDAMIVGALVLEDTGNMDGASEMLRMVLAAPSATDDQVRTARGRLDAISQ